jgi:DNA-binding HxlR family transcriptional regulator
VQSTLPAHVDYRLTPSGEQVADAVKALILSLYGVMPDVMRSREHSA